MKNKFLFSIICLTSLVVSSFVIAADNPLKPKLAISPPRLEMMPSEKANESITVLNLGSTPMQVEVSTQNWDLDQDNKFRPLAPTEQSLDQWLIINPVKLEIPANSQQTVRLAVRPRVKPEDGEHRAMVFFRQLPDLESKGAQINFKVGVPVYAYYGSVERTVEIHSVSFNQNSSQFEFDLSNTGNSYVRPVGDYVAVNANEYISDEVLLASLKNETNEVSSIVSGKLAADPVLANERRVLTSKVNLPIDKKNGDTIYLALKVKLGGTLIEKVFKLNP